MAPATTNTSSARYSTRRYWYTRATATISRRYWYIFSFFYFFFQSLRYDEVQVPALHCYGAEAELAEVGEGGGAGEAGGVRELPEGEVEAGERVHAEEGRGEVDVEGP